MKNYISSWSLICLLAWASSAFADDSVQIGCLRLALQLDAGLTQDVLEQRWGSGETNSEKSAVLELHGCKGELLDRLELEAPLARLDPIALRGTIVPTYLVSVDLTAPMGSYSGPLTIPVEIVSHHLKRVVASTENKKHEPMNLALTGKAAWKKIAKRGADEFFAVRCQPKGDGFVTSYYRYYTTRRGWKVSKRSEPGLWESDAEFPDARHFR